MLEKRRTAIVFTANTSHLANANLMIDSLLDQKKGNFKGDLWVISTALSDRAKSFCDSRNIKYLINTLPSWNSWDKRELVAKYQPEYGNFIKNLSEEESVKKSFEVYRNKRMSKLIILDWIEKFGDNYDFIALGDNDLYFQKDIGVLFDSCYKNAYDKISYCEEINEIATNSWLWRKDFNYQRFYDTKELDFGKNEINIGFILGNPCNMKRLFNNVANGFKKLNVELFTKYWWHDQDLVRLDRSQNPNKYNSLKDGEILHLCNGGLDALEEHGYRKFYNKLDKVYPYIIHFAGGAWKQIESVKDTYQIDAGSFFYENERTKNFDVIRNIAYKDVFAYPNEKYFTKEEWDIRSDARKEYLEMNNNKKNILFLGWYGIPTHNSSIMRSIPYFFNNDYYNSICMSGNKLEEADKNIPSICEEFPKILKSLTSITTDIQLIATYGFKIVSIPDWVLEDGLIAAKVEYGCSDAVARTICNLIYLYFSDALAFYHPDVVTVICKTGLLGKVISRLCIYKKIPLVDLEWGVLPGTIAFDVMGHMAESWISQEATFFNSLPISRRDKKCAEIYLESANRSELARTKEIPLSDSMLEFIDILKMNGKRIVLYMESNNAGSGNTYANKNQAAKHSKFFSGDVEAFAFFQKVIRDEFPNCHILYKPHPISITRGINIDIDNSCTTIIYEGGLNSCIKQSDLTVTLLSQSAYVSLLNNKPVIILGSLQLNDSNAAYILKDRSKECLIKLLGDALNCGYTNIQKNNFISHCARVLKYYVYSANELVNSRTSLDMARDFYSIILPDAPVDNYLSIEKRAFNEQLIDIDIKSKVIHPKVSIIIPVYNVEMYLSACLDSVINQTRNDIEIICIENGSTDNSKLILQKYAEIDERIVVSYADYPNQSNARNIGFDLAKGEYILFLDADDLLDICAVEKLVSAAEEKKCDAICYFYREMRGGVSTDISRPRFWRWKQFLSDEDIFKMEEYYYKFFIQYPFAPLKMIRRQFLLDKQIKFDTECLIAEDNVYNFEVLFNTDNIYILNECLYTYRIRNSSNSQSTSKNAITMIHTVKKMEKIIRNSKKYYMLKDAFSIYKMYMLAFGWTLIPIDLKEYYVDKSLEIVRENDIIALDNDNVQSYFDLPEMRFNYIIKRAIINKDKKLLYDKQHDDIYFVEDKMYLEQYKEENSIAKKEDVYDEMEPWQKISKPHLFAIKICEKLHIIKFAIKIKHVFIK